MRVFLSHSSVDKPFVRNLDNALRTFGIQTFLDERDIMIGEDFPQRIYNEIKKATHICYILSKNSVNSEWVNEELSAAKVLEKERKKTFIIPILIDNIEIPVSIKSKRYADFIGQKEEIDLNSSAFKLVLQSIGINPEEIKSLQKAIASISSSNLIDMLVLGSDLLIIVHELMEILQSHVNEFNRIEELSPWKENKPISRRNKGTFANQFGISKSVPEGWGWQEYHDQIRYISELHEELLSRTFAKIRFSDFHQKLREYQILLSQITTLKLPTDIRRSTLSVVDNTNNCIILIQDFTNLDISYHEIDEIRNLIKRLKPLSNTIIQLNYELFKIGRLQTSNS